MSEDRLGRKLSGDLVFCPAEDEGTEAIPKSDSVLFRLFFLDGVLVIRFKLIERAEIAGDEEAKEGPEFAKVILDRGAGEANTEIRLQLASRLGDFSRRIFDVLSFIEHDKTEVVRLEFIDITLKKSEGGDDEISVTNVGEEALPLRPLEHEWGERRSEFFSFGDPVWNDRSRSDDEGWPLIFIGLFEP